MITVTARSAAKAARRASPQGRGLRITKWRPMRRGKLAGYLDVQFTNGLRLFGLPVFATGTNGPWIGLPSRPRLDRERRQKLDVNGAPEFETVAEWKDRATSEAFSRVVLRLLLAKHPNALATEAAA